MPPLEPDLRRRFDVRTERFEHGGFRAELLLPRAADELIDEAEFDRDERLPYWAELWPSARALARWLLETPAPPGPALELGCGVALPSLALRWRGAEVVATDYYPEALEFARANAERNGLAPLETRLLDWRDPTPGLEPRPLVIAADVAYERRNAEALARLLPALVAPGGCAWIADPGRVHFPALLDRMRAAGWGTEEIARAREAGPGGPGRPVEVRLLRLAPPGP